MTALKTLIFTVLVPVTVAILIPCRNVLSAGARGPISTGSYTTSGCWWYRYTFGARGVSPLPAKALRCRSTRQTTCRPRSVQVR